MKRPKRVRIAVLTVAGAILALAGAFVWLQVTYPSDGARFQPGQQVWKPDGIIVTPLREEPGGLRAGDRVVAVDGRSMESWARALFERGSPPTQWRDGQTIAYDVIRDGKPLELAVTLGRYPLGAVLAQNWSTILYGVVFQLVAALVFFHRPDDPAAQALLLAGSSMLAATPWSFGLQIRNLVDELGFWLYKVPASGAFTLTWIAGLHFVLVFPRPHAIILKHPSILWLIYIAPYAFYAVYLAAVWPGAAGTLHFLGRWHVADYGPVLLYLALAVVVLVSGYWATHDAITRQQLRWVVFGGVFSGCGGLLLWILPAVVLTNPVISTTALGLLCLPFPLTLAVAVLRYRLFDIDLLINRTLVFGILSATLALVYFGSVVLLQQIVRGVTGQTSPLAVVVSTLGIAALFQPLRRGIQTFIDRRFYRRKYDAAKTLNAFGAKLRDEVDLHLLTDDVLAVVDETMQPAHVSLWLRDVPPGRQSEG